MPADGLFSLFVVAASALFAPLVLAILPGPRVPIVVGELVAGVALGTSGVGWIASDGAGMELLFMVGLAFVLFLGGLESDPEHVHALLRAGRRWTRSAVGRALVGMALRLTIAFAVTLSLAAVGVLDSPVLVALLLSSTSLGAVLSVLGERRLLRERFGQRVLVSAAVADLVTVVLLTLFISAEARSPVVRGLLIVLLGLLAVSLAIALRATRRRLVLQGLVAGLSGGTSQLRLRASLALLLGFVALAEKLGLEIILGAFLAGAVVSTLGAVRRHPAFEAQVAALGYGFFVPVFFVLAGARLDVGALLSTADRLALVPVLLTAVFVVKTLPAWLYRDEFAPRECLAAGVLQSAQLTLTVAGVEIGREAGAIDAGLGAALITVALLSMIIAPVAFSRLLPQTPPGASPEAGRSQAA